MNSTFAKLTMLFLALSGCVLGHGAEPSAAPASGAAAGASLNVAFANYLCGDPRTKGFRTYVLLKKPGDLLTDYGTEGAVREKYPDCELYAAEYICNIETSDGAHVFVGAIRHDLDALVERMNAARQDPIVKVREAGLDMWRARKNGQDTYLCSVEGRVLIFADRAASAAAFHARVSKNAAWCTFPGECLHMEFRDFGDWLKKKESAGGRARDGGAEGLPPSRTLRWGRTVLSARPDGKDGSACTFSVQMAEPAIAAELCAKLNERRAEMLGQKDRFNEDTAFIRDFLKHMKIAATGAEVRMTAAIPGPSDAYGEGSTMFAVLLSFARNETKTGGKTAR